MNGVVGKKLNMGMTLQYQSSVRHANVLTRPRSGNRKGQTNEKSKRKLVCNIILPNKIIMPKHCYLLHITMTHCLSNDLRYITDCEHRYTNHHIHMLSEIVGPQCAREIPCGIWGPYPSKIANQSVCCPPYWCADRPVSQQFEDISPDTKSGHLRDTRHKKWCYLGETKIFLEPRAPHCNKPENLVINWCQISLPPEICFPQFCKLSKEIEPSARLDTYCDKLEDANET